MPGLRKYRHHKKRLTPLAIIIILALIGIAGWYYWKSLPDNPKQSAPESQTKVKIVKTSSIVPDTTKNSAKTAPTPPKVSELARMKTKGWYILITKAKHELQLFQDGKLMKTYKVALGKNPGDKQAVGDLRTPEGHFYINYIKDAKAWTHDFKDGKGEIAGAYGPWYMALYTGKDVTFSGNTWTGIGIHGTHDPNSIGKNVSEGCIRLLNENLIEMKQILDKEKYVPVDIVP